MISQREKSLYFSFCGLQAALAVLLFVALYAINEFLRSGWLAAPGAYLQILAVMLLALGAEAATRPETYRLGAGRAPRAEALALARRQSLWLLGGFGVFLALTRDTSISRAFLVGLPVLAFPLFLATNQHGRRWLLQSFGGRGMHVRVRTLLVGTPEWCAELGDYFEGYHDFCEVLEPVVCTMDTPADRIVDRVAALQPDLLVFAARELPRETVSRLHAL